MRWYGRTRPPKFAIVCVGVWNFVYADRDTVDSWADAILEAMGDGHG